MKKKLLTSFNYLFCILCCLLIPVSNFAFNATDTIPYQGFRIHLTNIKLLKQKNDRIKISYDVVNTGRRDIASNNVTGLPASLVVDFEDALKSCNCQLAGYMDLIRQQIRHQTFKLSAGQMVSGQLLEVNLNQKSPLPDKIRERSQTRIASQGKPSIKEQMNALKKEEGSSEPIASVAAKSQQAHVINKKMAERTNRVPSKEARPMKTAIENPVAPVLDTNKGEELHPAIPPVEVFTEKGVAVPKEKQCADIIISQIKVKKQTKNWLVLEYTLHNIGNHEAKITGSSAATEEVFALKAFLASGTKLTRGSLPLGGSIIKELPNSEEGLLIAGRSFTGIIKLDISKKTRFTPNLILSLDPYLSLQECDRSNNTAHILLE